MDLAGNEKRLIDANALVPYLWALFKFFGSIPCNESDKATQRGIKRCIGEIEKMPTVDAVEVAEMREFAEDVACQFGYYCQSGGRLHITHGGLSTLEWAFAILGWENPHPVPEFECQIEGCHEHATCGTPTADGYKRLCGKHFAKMDGDGNA